MRIFVLFGLIGFSLAACDSPYGKDYSKPEFHASSGTGSHIRGVSSSSVESLDAGALQGTGTQAGSAGAMKGP